MAAHAPSFTIPAVTSMIVAIIVAAAISIFG